jgi:O-antigen/teichoic acid export membrane protein
MTGGGRFARNILSSYGLRALRAVSVLLLTPYLFRRLGLDGFGTWSVLFTIATVFSLIEYGATLGVTKHVAEHRGAGRPAAARETVVVGIELMTAIGVLALAVSAVLAFAADGLATPGESGAFRTGLLIIGAAQLVRMPGQALGATLMGIQRYDLFNIGEAVTVLSFLVGAIAAIELGGGLEALSLAFAVSLVLGCWAVLLRRADGALLAGPPRGSREVRRESLALTWRALLIDSMDFVAQRMDTLVVAALRSAAAAAPLAAATRLISGVQSLVLPFVGVLLPTISELDAAGRRDQVERQLVLSTRVVLHITLLTAGGLALFAGEIVELWLGPAAPAVTDDLVVLLMGVQLLVLPAAPAGRVLLGLGRLRAVTGLAAAEGVANLALSVALVSAWGVIGAAVATLVTSGLLVPLRIPLACRAAGARVQTLVHGALVPVLVACAPAAAVMGASRLLLDAGVVRVLVGLGGGWAIGAAAAAAQIGPRRLGAALRSARSGATESAV